MEDDAHGRIRRERDEALARAAKLERQLIHKKMKIKKLQQALTALGVSLKSTQPTPSHSSWLMDDLVIYLTRFLTPGQIVRLSLTSSHLCSLLSTYLVY